jgi:PAS domain S-box-containing protein
MMTARKLTYRELESKLFEMQDIIGALRHHEVDAIVGEERIAVVRLQEAEDALQRARAELEQRVVERTAELAGINRRLEETTREQERTRRQLADSERKYRELLECANSIILRRDTEGRITFFNESAQRFFGLSEQDVLGKNTVGTIEPETDSRGADQTVRFEEISRHPKDHPVSEGEGLCRDGHRVWISWTHRPIPDEHGRIVEILSVGNDITPLKQAETIRKETERRLLRAQQTAHLGNWEWNPVSGALWWSEENYRLFGFEPGQITPSYETFLSLVHPDDRTSMQRVMHQALENKRPYRTEFRIVRPDGRERVLHSEVEIAVDAEANVTRVAGTTVDVTERQEAQRQLEAYTSQLQDQAELLDLAHDMIFVHDMDGRIVFWNRGATLACGWKREEALGQLSHKLLQTEYSEPLMRITARIIKDGWWEGELVHTARDGRRITVASRWALRRKSDGRPTAILEIDTDVTERRRAEREMAEARQYAENIVDTIQESLVVLDPQLRVLSANRSFYETFGTAPDQVEGRLFHTLPGGLWDVPELCMRLREILPRNTSLQDFEVECADAAPRAFVVSARPIRQQAHDTALILLVIQDITVRKRQQREIEADKQQVASLTEELMFIEERQRRQIAATLHDSIGQSLIFAKRELGGLQAQAPPEMRDKLARVAGEIADAIRQTRDLTFELSPSTLYTFGLHAAIEELAEQFSENEGFACRVDGLDEPVSLPEQVQSMLYRAVRELLVNVTKHAGAGKVEIRMEHDGQRVKIAVQDDGRGFDPAALDGRSREHGFGLFSIRERLTHIGGRFVVESVEGQGTRITLVAPLDDGQQADRVSDNTGV